MLSLGRQCLLPLSGYLRLFKITETKQTKYKHLRRQLFPVCTSKTFF